MRCIGENFVNQASLCDLSKSFLELKNTKEFFMVPLRVIGCRSLDVLQAALLSSVTLSESDVDLDENERFVPKLYDRYAYNMVQVYGMLQPGQYSLFELSLMYIFRYCLKCKMDMDADYIRDHQDLTSVSLVLPDQTRYEVTLPAELATVAPSDVFAAFQIMISNPKIGFQWAVKAGKFDLTSDYVYHHVLMNVEYLADTYFNVSDKESSLFMIGMNAIHSLPDLFFAKQFPDDCREDPWQVMINNTYYDVFYSERTRSASVFKHGERDGYIGSDYCERDGSGELDNGVLV